MKLSAGGRELSFSRSDLFLLALAVLMVGYGGYEYVNQQNAIEGAVAVNATITDVGVEQTDGRGIDYVPVVSYEYVFEGTAYTGGDVFPGSIHSTYDTQSEARAVIDSYSVNQTATAYVDSQSPANAFLKKTTTSEPLLLAGGGGIIFIVALIRGRQNTINPGDGHAQKQLEPGATDNDWTVLGVDHGRLGAICKRCIISSLVATGLSVMGVVVVLLGTNPTMHTSSIQPDLFGPIGIAFLGAFLSTCALIGSLLSYSIWSYLEIRRARTTSQVERHRSLLGVLFADEDDLNQYEQQIRLTEVSLLIAAVLLTVLLDMLGLISIPG